MQHLVGKWNDESCLEFWKGVEKCFQPSTNKYRFNVCTDGNKQNITALQTVFAKNSLNYGKVKKIRIGAVVIAQIVKKVLGNMSLDEIGIRHIDGYCARIRERISRYCRRSKTFSKKRMPFHLHLCIFQTYNNFIEIYKDKKTPCMIEGITSKKWNWSDILMRFYHSH